METIELAELNTVQAQLNYSLLAPTVKRIFDVAVACLSLICVAPVLVVAMLCIVLETAGSPIYRQKRIGQNGRVFTIYKLRSMNLGADKQGYRTASNDNRLTTTGRFLRRLNIDELPQLVNIIIGDMSIIGPRPLSLSETQFLQNDGFLLTLPGFIPQVRPGLVGLEQVNRDHDLTYHQRFAFNEAYESSMSLSTDYRILRKAMKQCSPICLLVGCGAAILGLSAALVLSGLVGPR